MNSCVFNVNDLENSMKQFGDSLLDRLSPIVDYGIDNNALKSEMLREISLEAESYQIDNNSVEEAIKLFEDESFMDELLFVFEEEAIPSIEEIRTAMLSWKKEPTIEQENTSTDRLDNLTKNSQRIIEDPISYHYGRALRAKIRALQHVNTVGVHSILYNENGIVNNTLELNLSIKLELEKLYKTILDYLETQGIRTFIGRSLYDENNKYTGVLEEINSKYGYLFQFDYNELNRLYNTGDYNTLDSISSWVILNNYDTLLKKTFGKAIDIDLNKSKFNIGKYSVGGGSNVYTTWRTNEEIDLSKEINNISLAIVTSIPYYLAGLDVPSQNRNLKFNEFLYLISKLKDIPLNVKEDYVFSSDNLGMWIRKSLSPETLEFFEGKSVISVINMLRLNPLKIIPHIIELLNNETIFDLINSVLGGNYFEKVDRDIINSLYQGLFNKNNNSSLLFIQEKNGYDKTNYFAFITQTIDSMYKSNFLLYFRNLDGEIYTRPMYDLSISRIESDITTGINKLNSKMISNNYELVHEKYNTRDDVPEIFDLNDLKTTLTYIPVDGITYQIAKSNEGITIKDPKGLIITDKNILSKIQSTLKENYSIPSIIKYTVNDFYRGLLEVEINLNDGKITYLVNGKPISFHTKEDYDSLSSIIQDILKQNFNLDIDYLTAFGNRLVPNGTDFYGAVTSNLMNLVSRVIANQYILNNYMKNITPSSAKTRIDEIYKSEIGKPTYNKRTSELNFVTDSETSIIKNLAQAKALVIGRLTSSLIVDGDGNALASNSLSRLLNSLLYQVEVQIKLPNSAASEFSLWKPSVYKGVSLLKEYKEGTTSKAHTGFSNKEMENSLIFVDFLQGLITNNSTKSIYGDGIVGFYPSENSDKTYIGRLLIDLKNLKVGEESLYDILRDSPSRIVEFWPTIQRELGEFYTKALTNINLEWKRVGELLGIDISYGNWSQLNYLASTQGLKPIELVKNVTTEYNFNNPYNPIVLTEEVHYVADKNGFLMENNSFRANLNRLQDPNLFSLFMREQSQDVLKTLLQDGLDVNATPKIRSLIGEEWIDPYTNKVILGKDHTLGQNIRKYSEFVENNDIELNPLIFAYNSLNYFFTLEYMNSSVGAYYAHPNKKAENIGELLATGKISWEEANRRYLKDEAARKLALDKRNVSFTAAMHAFQLNLLNGVPTEINMAAMPDTFDKFETINGDEFKIKPFDGATFTNPFFQILLNNSLGGARVGLIKKTFTHYYNEKTGTGGIIKTAEFSLNNEYIRRSKFYEIMMLNMTDRVWRDLNGNILAPVDVTKDFNGNNIEFKNIDSNDGSMYYQDSTNGEYYSFVIESLGNNQYRRIVQRVDEHGIPTEPPHPENNGNGNEIIYTVDTNYKLWKLLGGERSMSFNKGKFLPSEFSINLVVKIMNNVGLIISSDGKVRYLQDLWLPLKHSDIHIMPTAGAVKQGIGNVNSSSVYTIADASKVNHMRIKLNLAGVLLDKEHHADGEDLSIMTQVISACSARGYTQEQTRELYNAMAALAKSGIKPYLKSFEEFFKVSATPNATPEQLEVARQNFENTLLDTLVKALANSTNNSATLQIITEELLEKAKEGKKIDFANTRIPLSDPSVMRKLHSTISVALTKAAIKIKVDGSLNILCPSFGIVKVYNGKMRENYLNDSQITRELKEWNENPLSELKNNPSGLKMGRTYKVIYSDGTIILKHMTPTEYYKIKSELPKITSIKEQFASTIISSAPKHSMMDPVDVRSELNSIKSINRKLQRAEELGVNIGEVDADPLVEYISQHLPKISKQSLKQELGFNDEDVNSFTSLFIKSKGNPVSIERASEIISGDLMGTPMETDSDVIRNVIIELLQSSRTATDITRFADLFKLEKALKNYESEYEYESDLIVENTKTEYFDGGRELASYNITFTGNTIVNEEDIALLGGLAQSLTKHFNLHDLVSVKNLHDLKASGIASKEQIDNALNELQKDLSILHSRNGQILTSEGYVELNPESIVIEPYEIVMPKIFATVFGLNSEDDLESIKTNPDFFLDRLFNNLKPTHNNYTLALQRINGNHVYILNSNDAIKTDNFYPKEFNKRRENGKLFRRIGDELEYEIGEKDQIWEYVASDGNSYEVIVTDSPLSYLDRIDYATLNINLELSSETKENIIQNLRNSKNKAVANYIEAIDAALLLPEKTLDNAIEDIQEINKRTYDDNPLGGYYKKLGLLIHASFMKSLEVVAARIPAQCMLSFMPMKIAGFEKSDRNTAYVSTTQFLFEGSDLDIDAVSLASYAFDKSGKYIIHSPLANINSYELLKESLKIPFPTGIELDFNYRDESYDYNNIIRTKSEKELRESEISEKEILKEMNKPFYMSNGNRIILMNITPNQIKNLANFISQVNRLGYFPASSEFSELITGNILGLINRHNNFINTSKDVEKFSKNYITSAMYDIGLSPANLIESQQAMDSITDPLKDVGNNTKKAKLQNSINNPANFTTNSRGMVQNMDGKQGVGICAVGLKSFFAATARYNEVLANGTPEEVERLKSDVTIAGKHFRMLANVYTTNEINKAILGEIYSLIDQGTDAALVLSGLLSLATDNAKELLLSKLNASKMLGMYIYGITIGMDFKEIAKIIASNTGQVIDALSKDDVISGNSGMSMENIFDYLELGPKLESSYLKVPNAIKENYSKIIGNRAIIRDMAWNNILNNTKYTPELLINYLESLKVYPTKSTDVENDTYDAVVEYNRNIEKVLDYVRQVRDIITDGEEIYGTWISFNRIDLVSGKIITPDQGIYGELKKLYSGGEELRRLGQLLHINQGNETSYIDALTYIDRVESAISSAQYRKFRERSRKEQLAGNKRPDDYSKLYEFNLHKFVFDENYRNGVIDLYDGECNREHFIKNPSYREPFINKTLSKLPEDISAQYDVVTKNLYPSKTFFNILDILLVPHYMEYLRSADLLHLLMLNSIKYRAIYNLGKTAIQEIGAHSQSDREAIFRRTELLVDRLIRDRFFVNLGIKFDIPLGLDYFVEDSLERTTVEVTPGHIKLGTRAGNASFKMLMEQVIIPKLKQNPRFANNKFIQNLNPTSFGFNPEWLTTVGYAPNINMSPRSESDIALFEDVKHDFNELRTTDYRYTSGGVKHDLINLFYYYNLITFGGRVGENTLTNIFQDVLDYSNIRNYRIFEAEQDKYGSFSLATENSGGNITLDTLIKETAPRATQSTTNLNYFYNEDYNTGKLSFYKRNKQSSYNPDTEEYSGRKLKYIGTSVAFTTDEDYKNYIVQSSESDSVLTHFNLDTGQKVTMRLEKGTISEINVDGIKLNIPLEDINFFKNLPKITRITPEGIMEKYYNKDIIKSKIEEIVKCSV